MSFPDPHHPWDPPESELGRVRWQDLDLPPGHPGGNEEIERILAQKPAHWLAYFQGDFMNMEGGPFFIWRPATSAGVEPAEVSDPVGQLDLAATFCDIAGIPVADWIEGELYDMEADPHQWHNLWDDPAYKSRRDDLVADLYDSLPDEFNRRDVESVA
jgi:hypothetical protein